VTQGAPLKKRNAPETLLQVPVGCNNAPGAL
jgi:hypothetical protein